MRIRPVLPADIPRLVELWELCSQAAHAFIPASYWHSQREAMAEQYLPAAETYVLELDGVPAGFISLVDSRVAALFVDQASQGKGLGKALLRHAMTLRPKLDLQVYQKNEAAVNFYTTQGFAVVEECTDPHTGEEEYVMAWEHS
ncbi:N-acetyltransferase [Paenibacillus sp. 1P07SE]|uniref:N-acetyltransferase n=1 Tax=Paenibacillus sp. 1P07SE TaxID=3132209 RepID=UPI0039A749CD